MKRYEVIYYVRRVIRTEVDVPNGDDPIEYAHDTLCMEMRDNEYCYDTEVNEIDMEDN